MLYTMTWQDDQIACEIAAVSIEVLCRLYYRLVMLPYVYQLHIWHRGNEIDPDTDMILVHDNN